MLTGVSIQRSLGTVLRVSACSKAFEIVAYCSAAISILILQIRSVDTLGPVYLFPRSQCAPGLKDAGKASDFLLSSKFASEVVSTGVSG